MIIAKTIVTTIDVLLGFMLIYGAIQRRNEERGAEWGMYLIILLNILAIWV